MIFMINGETVFYKVGKFVLNILKEPWHNPYQLIFTRSKSTMRDVERLSIVCVCEGTEHKCQPLWLADEE